jgi:hypothetical protein
MDTDKIVDGREGSGHTCLDIHVKLGQMHKNAEMSPHNAKNPFNNIAK